MSEDNNIPPNDDKYNVIFFARRRSPKQETKKTALPMAPTPDRVAALEKAVIQLNKNILALEQDLHELTHTTTEHLNLFNRFLRLIKEKLPALYLK
jgi:hypothetical protein